MLKKLFNHSNSLIVWLLCLLLSFLYSQKNIGGEGWLVPGNVVLWSTVVFFIGFTVLRGVFLNKFYKSTLWLLFGVMLLILITLSTTNSNAPLVDIAVYWLAMLIIWLFVGALLQYQLGRKQLLSFSFIVAIFAFIQAFISLVQVVDSYKVLYQLTGYYQFKFSGAPVGSFQQVNMLASFLALGLVSIFYLLTSPIKHWGDNKQRWLLVFMSVLIFYILLISGSRAGFLGFAFGIAWMFLIRYRAVLESKNWGLVWLSALSIGFVFSLIFASDYAGLSEFSRKMFGVVNGSDIREYLYLSTFRMFLEGPLLGYGLGSFNHAYMNFIVNDNIPKVLAEISFVNFTHPHNELLFWMIQSGVFGLLSIIVFIIIYLKALCRYSKSWALLVLGLLSPLLIQSQLSYPFSLSAVHLFLFLVLLAFGFKGKVTKIEISGSVITFPKLAILKTGVIILVFTFISLSFYSSWLTLKGIKEAYYFENRLFLYKKPEFSGFEKRGYFKYASQQPMFKFLINNAMQDMAEVALEKNNQYDMKQYILWSNNSWLKTDEITKENYKNGLLLEKLYIAVGEVDEAKLLRKKFDSYLIGYKAKN